MDEGISRNMYFEGRFGEEDAQAVEQRLALVRERDALYLALKSLYYDIKDYQRINKIGGHNNHSMRMARHALRLVVQNDIER